MKFEKFCTEYNIEPIYAPANDHRAIGVVERPNQTIKRKLSCMEANPKKNSSWTFNTCIYNTFQNKWKKQQKFHHSKHIL